MKNIKNIINFNNLKCVAGCKYFDGGEIYHHKHCPHYEDSFSQRYDELKNKYNNLINHKENKEKILNNKFREAGIRMGWIKESKEVVFAAMEEYANQKKK